MYNIPQISEILLIEYIFWRILSLYTFGKKNTYFVIFAINKYLLPVVSYELAVLPRLEGVLVFFDWLKILQRKTLYSCRTAGWNTGSEGATVFLSFTLIYAIQPMQTVKHSFCFLVRRMLWDRWCWSPYIDYKEDGSLKEGEIVIDNATFAWVSFSLSQVLNNLITYEIYQ